MAFHEGGVVAGRQRDEHLDKHLSHREEQHSRLAMRIDLIALLLAILWALDHVKALSR